MTQHEFVIRNGQIADGKGGDLYVADIAIDNGQIVAVGDVKGKGREEFDASGLLVTPGFVDIHTHYDAQVTWAERILPSSSHGVTTVLFGNCGVGFAPCRKEDRDILVHLMEGVEDIPEIVLTEGLPWNWTTFPEFLDKLEQRQYDIDIAALFPHAPLRIFVMGQRAADREPATLDDISKMQALTREALEAGAFGFATSRSINHRSSDGHQTPTLRASNAELFAIADTVGETGNGVIQLISDFEDVDGEFSVIRQLAQCARRPVSFTLLQLPHAPERWRKLLGMLETANEENLTIRGQVCGRPVGLFIGHELTFTPFSFCPSYQELSSLPLDDKIAILKKPEIRARILEEFAVPLDQRGPEIARAFASRTVDSHSMAKLLTSFSGMYPLGDPPNYEPANESSIAARAISNGCSPAETAYDTLLERDGREMLYVPAANFSYGNLDPAREMMLHDHTVLGLGDGGAHCSLICDASFSTFMLTHWARDRANGIPLPTVVKALTSDCAVAAGFTDRGVLAPGYRADINIIDHAGLHLHPPRITYDLPSGGKRLVQDAEGYVLTLVNGVPVHRSGKPTGALPGRLVRSTRMTQQSKNASAA